MVWLLYSIVLLALTSVGTQGDELLLSGLLHISFICTQINLGFECIFAAYPFIEGIIWFALIFWYILCSFFADYSCCHYLLSVRIISNAVSLSTAFLRFVYSDLNTKICVCRCLNPLAQLLCFVTEIIPSYFGVFISLLDLRILLSSMLFPLLLQIFVSFRSSNSF